MRKSTYEVAKGIVEAYDIVDPYGQMDAFNSMNEAIQTAMKCLTEWEPGRIKETIIEDLKGYITEGIVEGKDAEKIEDVITDLEYYVHYNRMLIEYEDEDCIDDGGKDDPKKHR